MENPFKFGTIVEEEYFTDRVQEVAYIEQFIQSANHLVLISPRRFGKSSVVAKTVKQSGRKNITVNNKPLQSGEYRTSTIYSALKRLQKDGYVIYSNHYEMEDPFFKEWILTNNK